MNTIRPYDQFRIRVLVSIAGCLLAAGGFSRAALAGGGSRHALTVGVSAAAEPLPRDVEAIGDIIESRAGYKLHRVGREQVSAADFSNHVIAWIDSFKEETADSALVYYRGAVVVGSDNTASLVMDRGKDERGADSVPMSFVLGELGNCQTAKTATLILDLVQDDSPAKIRSAIQRTLAGLSPEAKPAVSVVAMILEKGASPWQAMEQSRAGYWLGRGLRGEAECDRNGNVSVRELVTFLSEHLKTDAANESGRVFFSPEANAAVSLAELRRLKLEEVIADMADAVASQLHERGTRIVAVPDFSVASLEPTLGANVPGQDYGPMLRTSQALFKKELSSRSHQQFKILEQQWLREVLNKNNITPANIDGPASQKTLEKLKQELAAQWLEDLTLVVGSLQHRGGQVQLRCTPWNANEGAYISQSTATLTPGDWGMIGKSAVNEQALERTRIPAPAATAVKFVAKKHEPKPYELLDFGNADDVDRVVKEIERLEQNAKQEHPLLRSAFPIDVNVKVNGRQRRLIASKDRQHVYCTLAAGERYTINVRNNTRMPVFMRLLVDGLNTLPDRPLLECDESSKYETAVKDPLAPMLPAQYASLTNARPWHCGPGEWEIPGFFTVVDGQKDGLKADVESAAFKVTDASNSEAWQNGYPKDVGIISAAFYLPMARPITMAPSQRFGTQLGEREQLEVDLYQGKEVPGELIAVVHIRYGITNDE